MFDVRCSHFLFQEGEWPGGVRSGDGAFWDGGRFPAKAVWRCASHRTPYIGGSWACQGMECGGRVRHERRHRFGWGERQGKPRQGEYSTSNFEHRTGECCARLFFFSSVRCSTLNVRCSMFAFRLLRWRKAEDVLEWSQAFWDGGRFPAKAVSRCACHRTPYRCLWAREGMECGGRVRHERRHRFGWGGDKTPRQGEHSTFNIQHSIFNIQYSIFNIEL